MDATKSAIQRREPWNKGKLVGQKTPFKLKEIWAIRIRLQVANRTRELALFDLAIDSKLRACDLVRLRVRDVSHGDRVAARAIVMQQKTKRPVQFEITEQTKEAVASWITQARLKPEDLPLPQSAAPIATSLDAAYRCAWSMVGYDEIGLDPAAYGTHTLMSEDLAPHCDVFWAGRKKVIRPLHSLL